MSHKAHCRLSELGPLTEPGEYPVERLGIVVITDQALAELKARTDDPMLELVGSRGADGKDVYMLARILS